MLIEVLIPLTVRLNHQEQHLTPGQPVELPDEKALKLLRKAPGKVRIVAPDSHASSSPDVPAPYIGQVVQVEGVAAQRVLVVIAAVLEDDPRLAAGRWLGVTGTHDTRWVRERLVVDWQPQCRTCGSQRWWWSPKLVVFCATCHPPNPNWRQGFEELADWTDGIQPDDPRRPTILDALTGCDAAWLAKDWGRFQRHAFEVQWLVLRGSQPAEGGTDEQ